MAIEFHDDEAGEDQDHAEPSMNTTPLIDVLLVLLVMLIITIPIQLHSVNMDLPAGLPPPDAPEPVVVRLEVSSSNQVQWNGEPVADRAALDARFMQAAQQAEQPEIHVHADGLQADGQWIHMQPWLFSDGKALLRSSRLNNLFRKVGGQWLISRTRTENVFVAPLPNDFAEAFPRRSALMGP